MDTIGIAAAVVTGARHLRTGRNGQDAAVAWRSGGIAIGVVSDGCSSGASSEVGARLGTQLFARALGTRLEAGEPVTSQATWEAARGDVVRVLGELLGHLCSSDAIYEGGHHAVLATRTDRDGVIHDHFLFTIVAAAVSGDAAAVWALGDGAYSFGETTHVIGPFADNQPPYLAYDLLGEPRPAQFVVVPPCDVIVIATDGAAELHDGLAAFTDAKLVDHPDALRRRLTLLARTSEQIDWLERRVVRTPAVLQDDCAVAVLQRRLR